MKEAFTQWMTPQVRNLAADMRIRRIKNLALLLFAAGFFCFLLFGGEYLADWTLLDDTALRQIRDSRIERQNFFWYLCGAYMLPGAIWCLLWWCGFGKKTTLAFLSAGALTMGGCLAVCLMRYNIKGLFLWFVLYFPQAIFYTGALLCGLVLSWERPGGKEEKTTFLLQHMVWLAGGILSLVMGIYCESYWSSALLQSYLKIF